MLIKEVARCFVLALFILTMTNTAFAATETGDSSNEYLQTDQQEQEQVQVTPSVDQQTEQYTFSPDIPINGLFWNIGSFNGNQGYWNNLGEFFEKLPNPIKE